MPKMGKLYHRNYGCSKLPKSNVTMRDRRHLISNDTFGKDYKYLDNSQKQEVNRRIKYIINKLRSEGMIR